MSMAGGAGLVVGEAMDRLLSRRARERQGAGSKADMGKSVHPFPQAEALSPHPAPLPGGARGRWSRWLCVRFGDALAAGMGLGVAFEEPLGIDRGIELGGGKAGMAQQFLGGTQGAAPAQQMGGDGVAQD